MPWAVTFFYKVGSDLVHSVAFLYRNNGGTVPEILTIFIMTAAAHPDLSLRFKCQPGPVTFKLLMLGWVLSLGQLGFISLPIGVDFEFMPTTDGAKWPRLCATTTEMQRRFFWFCCFLLANELMFFKIAPRRTFTTAILARTVGFFVDIVSLLLAFL